MKNLPLLIGTIVGTLILIIAVAFFSSSSSQTTDQGQQIVDQTLAIGDARHVYTVAADLVSADATPSAQTSTESASTQENQELITIVEFSDFQCPACRAAQPAVENVKRAYPGKIQIIYRHFPLDSIHPNARLAAIAAEAASSLDAAKFWPMHDRLFAEQQKWSDTIDRQELKDTFATYAADLGLDRSQFLEKMEDNSLADLVNLDVSAGTQLGVNATPTFYVNGIKTSAPQLQATVESLLSK
ncbi:MAG: hypothetical protein BroJett025_09100 [Patescibacteria group bacterium]|nr:MAG: hypothetical protein BroJett025_09100 [Patescibacteria group bacterium]